MAARQAEQAAILEQLIRLPPGIAAVTAERGRGKSALAGMLLRQLGGEAIVTAPTRSAVEVLASFAGETLRFMAPDALLASKEKAAWLIVDEAAAIPAPLLRQLVSRFSPHATHHDGARVRGHRSRVPAEILRPVCPICNRSP
ncbi:putative acyl-CoA N-acyltransferase [Klebsiella pneumoniae]|uniref:Putative acyl-CoA N-acyltransferase n=1 Tax=Klebsiella pneumoniae TaxID=573 RepID=A0A447RMU9_KLEPN|nr:putative acyl-CoA N-acyltransferase [Klebsiella pneumoniae]